MPEVVDLRPSFLCFDDLTPFLTDDGQFDWSKLFGNTNPVELDVGCGRGMFLFNASTTQPERNFLGVELDFKEGRARCEAAPQAATVERSRDWWRCELPARPHPACIAGCGSRLLSRPVVEAEASPPAALHRLVCRPSRSRVATQRLTPHVDRRGRLLRDRRSVAQAPHTLFAASDSAGTPGRQQPGLPNQLRANSPTIGPADSSRALAASSQPHRFLSEHCLTKH